jgi:hypothetical protein
LSASLETAKRESNDWKSKYDHVILQQKADERKLKSQIASLESRVSISEGRLSATWEQTVSAQEEASEWKRKYEVTVSEAKTALQRAAVAQECTNKKVQDHVCWTFCLLHKQVHASKILFFAQSFCWKYALEPTGFDPLVDSDGFDPLWCKSPNGPQML